MNALLKFVSHYWHHEEEVMTTSSSLRVGEYTADYSPITAQEIAQTDSECDDLFKHSKPISR